MQKNFTLSVLNIIQPIIIRTHLIKGCVLFVRRKLTQSIKEYKKILEV